MSTGLTYLFFADNQSSAPLINASWIFADYQEARNFAAWVVGIYTTELNVFLYTTGSGQSGYQNIYGFQPVD